MNVAAATAEPIALLTGFAPFGGETINPSWQAVRALDGRRIAGHRVVAVELPCEFEAAPRALRAALRRHRPGVVIATGQAGGRAGISLERVAINLIDARIADNAGAQPIDVPVAARAPNAYFTTLPIKSALLALREAGIDAHVSHSAGTFVCNQVFYALMRALARRPGIRAGFVHVPWLPEQAAHHGGPGMPLADISHGLGIILHASITTSVDARLAAGTVA